MPMIPQHAAVCRALVARQAGVCAWIIGITPIIIAAITMRGFRTG